MRFVLCLWAVVVGLAFAGVGSARADLSGDEVSLFLGEQPEQGFGNLLVGSITNPGGPAMVFATAGGGDEVSNAWSTGYVVSVDLEVPNIVRLKQQSALVQTFSSDLVFIISGLDTPVLGVNVLSTYTNGPEVVNTELMDGGTRVVVVIPEQTFVVGANDLVLELVFEGSFGGVVDDLNGDSVVGNLTLAGGSNLWSPTGAADEPAVVSATGVEFSFFDGFATTITGDLAGDTILLELTGTGGSLENLDFSFGEIDSFITGATVLLNEFETGAVSFTGDSIEFAVEPQTLPGGRIRVAIVLEFGDPPPPVEVDTLLGDRIESVLTLNESSNIWDLSSEDPVGATVIDPGVEYFADLGGGASVSADLEGGRMTFSLVTGAGGELGTPTLLVFTEIDGPIEFVELESTNFGSVIVDFEADSFSVLIEPQVINAFLTLEVVVRVFFTPQLSIVSQPVGDVADSGDSLGFAVVAESSGPAVSYQWFRDGNRLVDDGRITGATAATLRIFDSSPADAGFYSVEASVPDGMDRVVVVSDRVAGGVRGPAPGSADIDANGTVDVFDLIAFLQAFSAALN